MSTPVAFGVSVVLLALNAFFVAAEFALLAAKPHRLEENASRGARTALRAGRQLPLMLAGAQFGITLCSLGLGYVAEPALVHLLERPLHAVGLPQPAGHTMALLVGLVVVVFLHMVVGEMAPKSWAITDPERSASLLARPFLAFVRLTRPVLVMLNGLANAAVRTLRVTPRDELATAHGPAELAVLLKHSDGLLGEQQRELLTRTLRLPEICVGQRMLAWESVDTVPADATAAQVEARSLATGRSRLPVVDPDTGAVIGVVHLHAALRASLHEQGDTARDLMTEVLRLDAAEPALTALHTMQTRRAQLAVVTSTQATGQSADPIVGVITLEDLLEQVIDNFDDETDTPTRSPATTS